MKSLKAEEVYRNEYRNLEPELCIAGIAAASRVPEASQAWVEGGVF
jgi:hypothetical protein